MCSHHGPAVLRARRGGEDEEPAHRKGHPCGGLRGAGPCGFAVVPPPHPGQVSDQKRGHQHGQQQPGARMGEKKRLVEVRETCRTEGERFEPDAIREADQKQIQRIRDQEARQRHRNGQQTLEGRGQQRGQSPRCARAASSLHGQLHGRSGGALGPRFRSRRPSHRVRSGLRAFIISRDQRGAQAGDRVFSSRANRA